MVMYEIWSLGCEPFEDYTPQEVSEQDCQLVIVHCSSVVCCQLRLSNLACL